MNKKLQVFVSSTYTDLIEERQAAVQAILDAGHIPAGMELFKAGNESQLKTIYKWIDESDAYMLILGGRYGSIEPKSGKSYTQIEYEYALSKNIPVFAVVLSKSFLTSKINSLGLENVMEQNYPDKHKSFKEFVMSKTIRKVDDCKDIIIQVHATLNEFMRDDNLTGWIRGNSNNTQLSDNINYDQLIETFKNKVFTFPSSILSSSNDFTIDALNLFVSCYPFYTDYLYFIHPENNQNAVKNNYLFRLISPFFLSYGLVKEVREASRFQITELGTEFYKYIESRRITNNYLINQFCAYYMEIIIGSSYAFDLDYLK